ncbi:DUF6089 family protein [Roseivirga sp.]|uniref:type IX secretion system protein PorG n=1 Tax=Roseivirga sp. TaxID=1964215 RepID=UPI0030811814
MSSLRSYRTDILSFKKFLLFLCFGLASLSAKAQMSEIGIEIGANNYVGDVVRKYDFSNNALGGQFFIRRHINDGVSYRISAGIGKIKGVDDEAFDVFSANRAASFDGSFLMTDLLLEYHFLNYRNDKLQQFWSPYVFFGAGLYRMEGQDQDFNNYNTGMNFRIPVGVGVKLRLDRRWVLGISTSAIKTNSDLIDNVSANSPNIKNYRGGNPNDDDWMFNTSISLSYTFYKIVCWKPFF